MPGLAGGFTLFGGRLNPGGWKTWSFNEFWQTLLVAGGMETAVKGDALQTGEITREQAGDGRSHVAVLSAIRHDMGMEWTFALFDLI